MRKRKLMRGVSVLGVGYTPLGDVTKDPEIKDFSERELFAQACIEAMKDGNVEAKDIDAFYIGMSAPNYYSNIKAAGPQFSEWIGMREKPTLFHDEGCGCTALGLVEAVMAVASGAYDIVITGGVNILKSTPTPGYPPHLRGKMSNETMWAAIYSALDPCYTRMASGGIGALEAWLWKYLKEYGYTPEYADKAFTTYSINQREDALRNPKALVCKETMAEEAKRFRFSDPMDYLLNDRYNPVMGSMIRGRFLGNMIDGASAAVICSSDIARQFHDHPIEIAGVAGGTELDKFWYKLQLSGQTKMFNALYEMADITDPYKEIEYFGLHDCTILPAIAMGECAGYFKPGEGLACMMEGRTRFDADRPITTDGGRVQLGHPIGPAFGIELAEAVQQMRGECGARQIKNPPKVAGVWGGGAGMTMGACILRNT